jgi:maleate cis-trans isomerase
MTSATRTSIGFIGPSGGKSPHYEPFKRLIPDEIDLDIRDLGVMRDQSLESLGGNRDQIVARAVELSVSAEWAGVLVPGAPVEIQNPGLFQALATSVHIPFSTALSACADALRAVGASRVLFLTPFNEHLNGLIRDHMGEEGFEASMADLGIDAYTDASKIGPDEVLAAAKRSLDAAGGAQAVYFQGAILDPLPVLARMERELGTRVMASNPTMLWSITSKLGLSYSIEGYGSLLEDWPKLVS